MLEFDPGHWEGLEGMDEEELVALHANAEVAVERAGALLEREVKKTLGPDGGPRSGRLYISHNKRGRVHIHQASAPGEPPAPDSGDMRKAVQHSAPSWDGWSVSVEVGLSKTLAPQGRRMEFGGVDSRGVRILPRPYFEPTIMRVMARIEKILNTTVTESAGERTARLNTSRAAREAAYLANARRMLGVTEVTDS